MKELTSRKCFSCKIIKDINDFCKNRRNKCGYNYKCKNCCSITRKEYTKNNKEKLKKNYHEKYREKNLIYSKTPLARERAKKSRLKTRYGLSVEDFERMKDSQKGVCAICKLPETFKQNFDLSVDHNHDTGQVRGLLCNRCNVSLGLMQENINFLENMIEYIKKYTN